MYMYKSLSLIFLCKKKRLALTMHVFIKKNPHLLVFQLQRSITGYLFLFCLLLKLKVGRGEVSLSLKRNPN